MIAMKGTVVLVATCSALVAASSGLVGAFSPLHPGCHPSSSSSSTSRRTNNEIRQGYVARVSTISAVSGNGGNGGNDDVSDQVLQSLTEKLERSKNEARADEASALPDPSSFSSKKKDNKAMAFLRKVGRVGGAANKNFVNAVGSDEGTTGRQPPAERGTGGSLGGGMKKSRAAYKECTATGIIDDMTEPFPLTSSGTEWRGVSDRVVGGISNGSVRRETDLEGRAANVLSGRVSLRNGGGFLQMVTDLPLDPSRGLSVDASDYDGVEVDVLCRHEPRTFNVHLRTPGTFQTASYRYTHELGGTNSDMEEETSASTAKGKEGEGGGWRTVRIPFSSFVGHSNGDTSSSRNSNDKDNEEEKADNRDENEAAGPAMAPQQLDPSALKRIGIVAIGEEMDAFLAVAGVRFYSVF